MNRGKRLDLLPHLVIQPRLSGTLSDTQAG